jgi:hypothetical protein
MVRRSEVGRREKNSEGGPVVVPNERDYAAARMRKWERRKLGSWEGEKVRGSEVGRREKNSEVGPVVVPNERDYAAARMRKAEK